MDDLWDSTIGYRARNIDFIHGDVHGMAYKNMVLNFPLYTPCREYKVAENRCPGLLLINED